MKLKNILYCLALSTAMAACVKGGDPLKPLPSEGRVTLEVYSDNPLLEMDESGDAGQVAFKTRGGSVIMDVLTNQGEWKYEAEDSDWLEVSADRHFLTISAATSSRLSRSAT